MDAKRWKRFGHDRLYVLTDDGQQLGWWDLAKDIPHPEKAEDGDLLAQCAAAWLQQQPMPTSAPTSTPQTVEHGAPPPDAPEFTAPPTPPAPPPIPTQAPAPTQDWAPPTTAPVVADLAANPAGLCLMPKVAQAQAATPPPTFWQRLFRRRPATSAWELGLQGEQLVDAELRRMSGVDPRWRHINSIPIGTNDSDIDHLLICPAGVFTINTKYHRNAYLWVGGNTVMVNGTRHPYVRNSRHEAQRASRLLSNAVGTPVPVRGLIVPVGLRALTIRRPPEDVVILGFRRFTKTIKRLPAVLTEQQIHEIYEYARRSSTWKPLT